MRIRWRDDPEASGHLLLQGGKWLACSHGAWSRGRWAGCLNCRAGPHPALGRVI